MIGLVGGGGLAWYQSRGPEFNHSWSHINSAARNNSHISYCSLGTHMTRAHDHDSHVIGGMLKLGKRLHRPFYITWVLWLDWSRGSSSMISVICRRTYARHRPDQQHLPDRADVADRAEVADREDVADRVCAWHMCVRT
jgi:hypothetical protein